MKRILDAGMVATITPDGPRGPARIAASVRLRWRSWTGKPVVPVAWAVSYWRAPGWDGMIIPKPSVAAYLVIGDLIDPPPSRDRDVLEAHRVSDLKRR